MTTETETKTDRQRFHHVPANTRASFLFYAFQTNREESIVDGLRAFAQVWFDEFDDATDLPAEFWAFVKLCEEPLTGIGVDCEEFSSDA